MEQEKIEYDGATEALLDEAYGDQKEQIKKCDSCNARFVFKGRREIAFCAYCAQPVRDGSERQETLA